MSSRAAARLETLSFSQVYEYKPGKSDWRVAGLPMEGPLAAELTALAVVRRDVPTAQVGEHVEEAHTRGDAAGWKVCIVVNSRNQVLGRLRGDHWNADPNAPVEDVMEEGPTTFRASEGLEALVERMQRRQVGSVLITDPEGVLIGVLFRQDAERLLKERKNGSAIAHES
jgi:Mg/Co/Ni transporter MgtE